MKICIDWLRSFIEHRPKLKQWLWFAGLWLAGLICVLALAYPIRYFMHSIG